MNTDYTDEANRYAVEWYTPEGWAPYCAWHTETRAWATVYSLTAAGIIARILDMTTGKLL